MFAKLSCAWVGAIGIALSWSGLIITVFLFVAPFENLCGVGGACEKVLQSRYAAWRGIPLSALGIAFYTVLLGCFLGVESCESSRSRARFVRVIQVLSFAGAFASAGLIYVQAQILRAFCTLCTASALVMIALCIVASLLCPTISSARRTLMVACFAVMLISLGSLVAALRLPQKAEYVLSIDGQNFTAEDISRESSEILDSLETAFHAAKLKWIDQKIKETLLNAAAKRVGTSVEELVSRQIESRVVIPEEDIAQFLAEKRWDPSEANREHARGVLAGEKREKLLAEYVETLKPQHKISVNLPQKFAQRIPVDFSLTRDDGPTNAPVSLIVFSDFDCPFCSRFAPVLRKIRSSFPDEVRIGFRYFPSPDHARARPASEAAECAARQGKFWEYHDKLFENSSALTDANFRKIAKSLNLDEATFEQCLQTGAGKQAVETSYADAVTLRIEGTPAVFLNGRMVGGMIEFEKLSELIREELARIRHASKPRAN